MIELSICIPTYNRAKILSASLDSIVCQEIFCKTDKVEVIVSDNCSTDDTREVVSSYINKYGNKIKYFCNEVNVFDENFSLALMRGNGTFLKLCNDTIIFKDGMLKNFISIIEYYKNDKPIIFFKNSDKETGIVECDFSEFVSHSSFIITWIGGLGIWKSDREYLHKMKEYADTMLSQAHIILNLIADRKKAVVYKDSFCSMYTMSVGGKYNLFEIFIQNYLKLYEPYLKSGLLKKSVYEREKFLILRNFVLPRYVNIKYNYLYKKDGFWKYTVPYHKQAYFYYLLFCLFLKWIKDRLKNK